MEIKAAIFDMDGTLVDSLGFWEIYWEQMGKDFLGVSGFRPAAEDDRAIRTMTMAEAMTRIQNNYNVAKNAEELIDYANKYIAEFYVTQVDLKPGVREFLDYLKANGTRMCIASATNLDNVMLAVDHCGIRDYFEEIISCAVVGAGKDKPDVFLAAKDLLGTKIEETFVFEDSYIAVKTAKSIGMPTVGIFDINNSYREELKATADYYIVEGETMLKLIK
jgi:HAD superfamily hydrolase (TIGR01509 family)